MPSLHSYYFCRKLLLLLVIFYMCNDYYGHSTLYAYSVVERSKQLLQKDQLAAGVINCFYVNGVLFALFMRDSKIRW